MHKEIVVAFLVGIIAVLIYSEIPGDPIIAHQNVTFAGDIATVFRDVTGLDRLPIVSDFLIHYKVYVKLAYSYAFRYSLGILTWFQLTVIHGSPGNYFRESLLCLSLVKSLVVDLYSFSIAY